MKESKRRQSEKNSIEIMDFNDSRGDKRKTTSRTKSASKRQTSSGQSAGQAKKAPKINNREFAIVTYFFLFLFIALTGYFVYFVGFRSEDFINSPYNARLDTFSLSTVRGRILAQDQTVLAETIVGEDGSEFRHYPYGSAFAHAVGYSANGMAGVELDANFNLLRSNAFFLERLFQELQGEKKQGDDVVTTLNVDAQRAAYEGMGSYDGAVVALEPSTGKILAMVSKPDYDPNTIESRWGEYTSENSTSTVLLNRAIQGLYPPGSTFKIVTTLAYIRENQNYQQYSHTCSGVLERSGFRIHCYRNTAHGPEGLTDAFINSCNSAYAEIGLSLDRGNWQKLCEQLLFNRPLPTRLSNTKNSSFSLGADTPESGVMQTAIGQGETLVTPMHMAMIAAAIANDGVLMEPYVIDYTQNHGGDVVKTYSERAVGELISRQEADVMEGFMEQMILQGTGEKFSGGSYQVFGKTGTAEYNSNKDDNHSWFVGYAKDLQGRELAIAVVMEGAGSGSAHAVPLARKVFDAYYH